MRRWRKDAAAAERTPIVCGADVELGNFILGPESMLGRESHESSGFAAARALLAEIEGVDGVHAAAQWQLALPWLESPAAAERSRLQPVLFDQRDWGRKYLPENGGCAYIDLGHLEICTPETLSVFDHLGCWLAMLRLADRARRRAELAMPPDQRLQVLVNNSDGRGNSYGSHLSFLVTRRLWENLFNRKLHQLLFLASYQISSMVFTGQGKVGSENGRPKVSYQLSQRGDFFESLVGRGTTFRRPVVNQRDEPLCGVRLAGVSRRTRVGAPADQRARLHVIFYDSNLCHAATLLKVGVLQIVLAMLEEERTDPTLILDDPLGAIVAWGHDPTLRATALLADGRRVTAVEWQQLLFEEAERFVAAGGCAGRVPGAGEILDLWRETIELLAARDFDRLAGRLDWVLKLELLERALAARPGLDWASPEVKHLDHLYSSLDPEEGLYWASERDGRVERWVDEEAVAHFLENPPADTRAWARAALLRSVESEDILRIDWDRVELRGARGKRYRILLDDPAGHTERELGSGDSSWIEALAEPVRRRRKRTKNRPRPPTGVMAERELEAN